MAASTKIVGVVFTLVGFGLLAGGGYAGTERQEFLERAVDVQGTIVGAERSTDSDGDDSYAPIYSFTYDGEQRRSTGGVSSSSQPDVGETRTLRVDPQDPEQVVADTFLETWFITVLLGGMGLLFSVIGLAMLVLPAIARARRGSRDPGSYTPLEAPDARRGGTAAGADPIATPAIDDRDDTPADPLRGPFL